MTGLYPQPVSQTASHMIAVEHTETKVESLSFCDEFLRISVLLYVGLICSDLNYMGEISSYLVPARMIHMRASILCLTI